MLSAWNYFPCNQQIIPNRVNREHLLFLSLVERNYAAGKIGGKQDKKPGNGFTESEERFGLPPITD